MRFSITLKAALILALFSLFGNAAAQPYRPLLTLDLQGAFRTQWEWRHPLGQELALHVPADLLVGLPANVSSNASVQIVAALGDPERPYDRSRAIMKSLGQPILVKSLFAGGESTDSLSEPYVKGTLRLTALDGSHLLHLQWNDLWLGPAADHFLSGLFVSVTPPGSSTPQMMALELVPSVSSDMTAALHTARAGSVFAGTEPCTLDLAAFRVHDSPKVVPAVLTITDSLTQQKQSLSTKLDFSQSPAWHKSLILPLHHYGVFLVDLQVNDREIASTRVTRIAMPQPVSDASPFGINLFQGQNWSYTFDLPLMAQAGVKWIRPWLEWENNAVRQEPTPGRWDWKPLDITLARSRELSLAYAYMFWTSGPMSATSAPGPTTWWTDDAAANQGWTEYAKTVVEKYKDHIHVWEFWNEPYSFTTGEKYLLLVKALNAGVEASDPTATRIGMGGTVAPDFTQAFVDSGGLNFCDAVSCHLYSQAMPPGTAPEDFIPQELDVQENLMTSPGKPRVPIWLNEVSYSADAFDPTYGKTIGMSERTQAQFLVRTYLLALSKTYVDKVLWFCTLDPRNPQDQAVDASVGITYIDHTPKLAYAALSALCRQMGVPKLIGRLDVPSPARAYAWNVRGETVVTAWSDGNPVSIHLPVSVRSRILDMMGNPLPITAVHGSVTLALTGSPLYLYGMSEAAAKSRLETLTVKAGAPDAFTPHDFFGYRFFTDPGMPLSANIPTDGFVHITNTGKAQTVSVSIEGMNGVTATPAMGKIAVPPGQEMVYPFQAVSTQDTIVEPLVVQSGNGTVRIRLQKCPIVFASAFGKESETGVKQAWVPTADFYDTLSWDAPGFSCVPALDQSHSILKLGPEVAAWTGFKSIPIAVKPNTTYMLSYVDKTDSVAPGTKVWSFIIADELKHHEYPTTITQTSHQDWAQDESVFRTTANAKSISIKLQKNDKVQGSVWFENIRLVELTPARN